MNERDTDFFRRLGKDARRFAIDGRGGGLIVFRPIHIGVGGGVDYKRWRHGPDLVAKPGQVSQIELAPRRRLHGPALRQTQFELPT